MNPDAHGWYRVHAVDGSGLDYSTNSYDPEIHVLVDAPASDAHGRPNAATPAEVVEESEPAEEPAVDPVVEPIVGIPDPADAVPGKTKAAEKGATKAEEAKQ